MKENLYFAEEARPRMMSGIQKIARAVGSTMGTAGQNGIIEDIRSPKYLTTNDGYTIANSIVLADPLEDLGKNILIEAINRANKASGDGSSTTCVLTAAILEEGLKHLSEASPMEIKRSLESCIPEIEKSIKEQTKKITIDEVGQVASISAEDESIGNMIQEIYQKIGKDGIINWDVSKTPEDSYTIGTGITMNGATYVSRYMCDLANTGLLTKVTLNNPLILLARKKIISAQEVDSILEAISNEGIKEIVIFCEDIEITLINSFIALRQQSGFRVVVVKMPVLWADEWWEDLAFATGGMVIGQGIKMQDLQRKHLGTVEHITIDSEDTYLDGIKDLTKIGDTNYDHILALKVDGSDQALNRAARLNTKTARYFVGAQSESALAYRRLKVEDSINAASCALENGIVAGGGIALMSASANLHDKTVGEEILKTVLLKPFDQIVLNCGKDLDEIYKSLTLTKTTQGFDSKTGKIVDMFDEGIVDPADVVLSAVKAAIGVAASILTVGSVVLLPRKDEKE